VKCSGSFARDWEFAYSAVMNNSVNNEPLRTMSEGEMRGWIERSLPVADFAGKRVLLIVPDATRTAPMPVLFSAVHDRLAQDATKIDVLVALGTHPPMSEERICELLGISSEDRKGRYADVGLFNHEWDREDRLTTLGLLSKEETAEISDGLLSEEIRVQINSRIQNYDSLLVIGPVFPHEVVGFSGGNKYFFPGISGPELLNFFHWLGALLTNCGIIGIKGTAVRKVVDRAALLIPNERRCLAFVVGGDAKPYGMFYGTPEKAWAEAADLSARVHIQRVPKPFRQVLSCAPAMYDELWVAGKCMYKLEPVVADGGELIIYAPHMKDISVTHGALIEQIGYHVRDYFLGQPDRFTEIPRGVLAHSTHVRGGGSYENGVEKPRVQVTLASGISEEVCQRINLGYRDPATIDVESFANREDEGILLVRKAGEMLYRLEGEAD
jgi:lactate racemase